VHRTRNSTSSSFSLVNLRARLQRIEIDWTSDGQTDHLILRTRLRRRAQRWIGLALIYLGLVAELIKAV
jgi:hypothetical protein